MCFGKVAETLKEGGTNAYEFGNADVARGRASILELID